MPRKFGLEVLEWCANNRGLKTAPDCSLDFSNQSPDINRAYELGAKFILGEAGRI